MKIIVLIPDLACVPGTPVALQALLHGISQAKYWSGLPFHSPGDPHNPGTEPKSPAL